MGNLYYALSVFLRWYDLFAYCYKRAEKVYESGREEGWFVKHCTYFDGLQDLEANPRKHFGLIVPVGVKA